MSLFEFKNGQVEGPTWAWPWIRMIQGCVSAGDAEAAEVVDMLLAAGWWAPNDPDIEWAEDDDEEDGGPDGGLPVKVPDTTPATKPKAVDLLPTLGVVEKAYPIRGNRR